MNFDAFNINFIPRLQNAAADLLATSATIFVPTNNKCLIEFIVRPSFSRKCHQFEGFQ